MAAESNDSIREFIDLDSVGKQKEVFVKDLKEIYALYQKINNTRLKLEGSSSIKETTDALKKLRQEEDELSKINRQIEQTYQKRVALESQKAKVLAEEKELLRQRNAELKNSVREQNAAEGSLEKMRATLIRLNKEYDNMSAKERNAAKGQELKNKINGLSEDLKKLEGETGRYQRNVGNYSSATKILEKSLDDVKKKLDEANRSGNQNGDVIAQLEKEYNLLDRVLKSNATGFVSMKQEIKENQVAIEQLSRIYGEDAEVVRELIRENGKLRDSFEDLKAAQKAQGSDTFAFDAALQGLQGLAGMYSVATGAAAIFGNENEEVQKSMQKLMAVMTILQGIQAAVNALQGESALIQGIQTARTYALGIAQKFYTTMTVGATAATKAFRAVLLSLGLGVILFLLTSFTSKMVESSDAISDAADEQDNLNDKLQDYIDKMDKIIGSSEKVRNAQKNGLNQRQRELALLEAQGAKEDDIYKKKNEVMQQELQNSQIRLLSYAYENDKRIKDSEQYKMKMLELEKDVRDKENQIVAERLEFERRKREKAIEEGKKAAERRKELQEREARAQFEIAQSNIEAQRDMFRRMSEDESLAYNQRLSALEEVSRREIQLAIGERDFLLKDSKLTKAEREKIKLDAARKIVQIEVETQDAIQRIIKDAGEKQKEEAQKAADKRIEAIDTKMANRVLRTQTQLNDSLRRLNESFLAGEIDSVESYEQQKAAIMTEYADKNFNEQISNLQDLVAEYTKQGKDTTELEKRISDLKIQYSDVATASAIDNAKKEADAKKLYAEKEKELQQQLYDKRIELARQAAETIKEFLIAPYEVEKNAIQDQINALEIKKNKDIEVAKQTITNQQDQAAAITTINASAQAQREQLEQKQRQVDQQKARFERVYRGFQITASTIEAVAKIKANAAVLASNPITLPLAPMALAQIPVTIGIGAAQLAALFATPIPRYAVGTSNHPGGPAIVGDGGKMEGVITPDGSLYVTPDTPTVTNLPKGSVVIPDVNDITAVAVKNSIPKSMNYDGALMSNLELIGEVKRMRGDITAAIKNKRENHYHVTRHGLLVQQMSDNNQIDYLNENLQF